MKKFLVRVAGFFYDPVSDCPLLFCIVVFCCCVASLLTLLTGGLHNWPFLLYAFLQGTAWGWIVCAISRRRKVLRMVFATLFLLCGLIEMVHFFILHRCVLMGSVHLLLNTDAIEAKGFIVQFMSLKKWLALLIGLVCLGFFVWQIGKSQWRLPKWPVAMAVFPFFVCAGLWCIGQMLSILGNSSFSQLSVWETRGSSNPSFCFGDREDFTDPITKAVCYYQIIHIESHNTGMWSDLQKKVFRDPAAAHDTTAADDSLQVVVIIGESFIRSHSSLYGYPLDVNPGLERELREGALSVFTDATSPASLTSVSIPNILNMNSVSRGEKWWEYPSFSVLFARAGWDVDMFTNQYPENTNADIGPVFFDKFLKESVYKRHNVDRERYDGEFLSAMADTFNLATPSSRHSLTIWHLRGQHFPASMQFPPSARQPFKGSDIKADKPWLNPERRQTVADYANATLYNDSVVTRIFDLYRNRPAIVFYFSDHGEEMWDVAPAGHRTLLQHDDVEWMRRLHDVPFFVWMSEPLRRKRPELKEQLDRVAKRPVSLDLIGHTLLNVAGISSPYYRPQLDVLSPGYVAVPRVTEQGFHYDR